MPDTSPVIINTLMQKKVALNKGGFKVLTEEAMEAEGGFHCHPASQQQTEPLQAPCAGLDRPWAHLETRVGNNWEPVKCSTQQIFSPRLRPPGKSGVTVPHWHADNIVSSQYSPRGDPIASICCYGYHDSISTFSPPSPSSQIMLS